ncbi:MAG: hypothetical protein JWM32_2733 [Verrucomicrobia bacterium]|nr:hypothetical protein [Verrucomicrobiota bacterium]
MNETVPGRNLLRSTGAVFLGIFVVFVLSLGTDQVLHVLKIYPPWNEAMWDNRLNALALSYRIVYGVVGGFVTAKCAPRNPLRHALIMGWIGFGLSVAGAIGGIVMKMGPAWYPIVLALTALPCAWAGGRLGSKRSN